MKSDPKKTILDANFMVVTKCYTKIMFADFREVFQDVDTSDYSVIVEYDAHHEGWMVIVEVLDGTGLIRRIRLGTKRDEARYFSRLDTAAEQVFKAGFSKFEVRNSNRL